MTTEEALRCIERIGRSVGRLYELGDDTSMHICHAGTFGVDTLASLLESRLAETQRLTDRNE